jgi:hypothetical protein
VSGLAPEDREKVDDLLMDAAGFSLVGPPPQAILGQAAPAARHIPGTAPKHIRAPSWWKGDRAAFRSSWRAAEQIEPMALAAATRQGPG